MFAYCNNNPVNGADPYGNTFIYADDPLEFKEDEDGFIKYDVPFFYQGQLSLCWAFCQVMVEAYRNGEKLSKRDATERAIIIAKRVANSDDKEIWNDGGWPENRGDEHSVTCIYDLYQLLVESGGPIYAYYCNPNTHDAHLVVVTGVDVNNDIVYTNNPRAKSGRQTFAEFQSGITTRWYQSNLGMELDCVYTIDYN